MSGQESGYRILETDPDWLFLGPPGRPLPQSLPPLY